MLLLDQDSYAVFVPAADQLVTDFSQVQLQRVNHAHHRDVAADPPSRRSRTTGSSPDTLSFTSLTSHLPVPHY